MMVNKSLKLFPLVLTIFAIGHFMNAASAAAETELVLYNFDKTKTSGNEPQAGLVIDSAGNLYGTTSVGGPFHGGIVFELSPKSGGGWTEKPLHSFGSGKDGAYPEASLVFDSAGNLYSTTSGGGAYGGGTVFELSPEAGGRWEEKLLHSFGSGTDGSAPDSNLIFDASGNLYGTASSGGAYAGGIVFQLTPQTGGRWSETILHSFNLQGGDGYYPLAGVILDGAGNLYGTTQHGGVGSGCSNGGDSNTCGTVFELESKSSEKILHSFTINGSDGGLPVAGLIFDSAGNLYGTCVLGGSGGGTGGAGIVFELTPGSNGDWTETVLHSFAGRDGGDGSYPESGLIFDKERNLYGTTAAGGVQGVGGTIFGGTVFELSDASGGWSEKILYTFDSPSDGLSPDAGLIFDSSGNVYGTTVGGGAYGLFESGGGTVFEIRL
jgi:uncharacterized repeat protein (TIGR03803 family)